MGYDFRDPARAAITIKDLSTNLADIGPDINVHIQRSPLSLSISWPKRAGFTLMEQPNCCGVLISTKTYVEKDFQGSGMAQAMMPLKEAIAKQFGYSCLSATVNISGNPKEAHILEKCGWTKGFEFVNARTKNTVAFYQKKIV